MCEQSGKNQHTSDLNSGEQEREPNSCVWRSEVYSGKRKRDDNESRNGENGRSPKRPDKDIMGPPSFIVRQPRFACPFQKLDPVNNKFCMAPGEQNAEGGGVGFARVKQHVLRVHDRSAYCSHCWKRFDTEEEKIAHREQGTCTESRPPIVTWLSLSQAESIRTLSRRATNEDRWYDLFLVLFPDLQRLGIQGVRLRYSPYYEQAVKSPSIVVVGSEGQDPKLQRKGSPTKQSLKAIENQGVTLPYITPERRDKDEAITVRPPDLSVESSITKAPLDPIKLSSDLLFVGSELSSRVPDRSASPQVELVLDDLPTSAVNDLSQKTEKHERSNEDNSAGSINRGNHSNIHTIQPIQCDLPQLRMRAVLLDELRQNLRMLQKDPNVPMSSQDTVSKCRDILEKLEDA